MTWQATTHNGYEVARQVPGTGEILLMFGKHQGERLAEVPDAYLRWMLSASGRAFLPDELLAIVEAEVQARVCAGPTPTTSATTPAARPPFITTTVNVDDVLAWAATAPAGDVLDVARNLRTAAHDLSALAEILEDGLKAGADELIERLIGQGAAP